jgi:hypothetical protein
MCKGTMYSGMPGIEIREPVGGHKTMCEYDTRDSDSPALLFIPLHKGALWMHHRDLINDGASLLSNLYRIR